MITTEYAHRQAERLGTMKLRFGDDHAALVKEYMSVLLRNATSEDHARRSVDDIMANHEERITGADLARAIADTAPTQTVPRPNQCATCGGTQFIPTTVTAETGRYKGMIYDAVRLCQDCHKAETHPDDKSRRAWHQPKIYHGFNT